MKLVSRIALGAALALGVSVPVFAQQGQQAAAPAPRQFNFSKEERAALLALQTAVDAKDTAAATPALAAARAAAKGSDAKYAIAGLQLRLGLATQNLKMQSEAIDAMIASGGVAQADLPQLYSNQAALANQAGDLNRAEFSLTQLVALTPNDPNNLVMLAEVKNKRNKTAEALPLLERAFEMRRASGQAVPENWYKRALKLSYDSKLAPQSLKFSRDLVAAYPTQQNWRDTLLIYQELSGLDKVTQLDLYRLKRAAKALAGERDFMEMANELDKGGLPGESRAVLEEGVSMRMIDASKSPFKELLAASRARVGEDKASLPSQEKKALAAATGTAALNTADAYYGYGDYAKAATLYRAALQKGGVDANLVNTRLGMALAQSGQRAEAETAFRAVTGPRAELANYWMLWLSKRA